MLNLKIALSSTKNLFLLFELVYLLNRLTVFCNFLHDGRRPLGEETEYALIVIRGQLVGN